MPSLNRNEKVTCENCGTQTTRLNLGRHKKNVQLEHFIVLIAPVSQHDRKLNSTFITQENIAYPSQKMFTGVNFSSSVCWFLFLEITSTEGTRRTKCFRDHKCGCDTIGGSNSR